MVLVHRILWMRIKDFRISDKIYKLGKTALHPILSRPINAQYDEIMFF